jgi:glutaconate CoA-transferase subunit B
MNQDCNIADFLVANLETEIEDGMTIVQGTATFIPFIAAQLAMKKKKMNFIGGFMLNPKINPLIPSTFSPYNYSNEKAYLGLSGFLDLLQQGRIDLEFLRPAQVDKFGNMNNTCIGVHKKPLIRFPGGMGMDDVMTFIKKIILYVPNHSKKVFTEKVDFVTAHGWDKGKGPDKIITNMCIFEFPNGKITLTGINPDYTPDDVKKETGFNFEISKNLKEMILPSKPELKLINKADPVGLRHLEIKEKREEILKKFR